MPLVKIEIVKGHTAEYKSVFLKAVAAAMASALGIPEDDIIIRLYEVEGELFKRDHERTDNCAVIELAIFTGRSAEIKRKIIKEVTSALGNCLGVQPVDIFIIINEPSMDNWGLRGEQASKTGYTYSTE